ncbi:MAG: hypothetical protein LV481_05375 [Methylacidiphilales bacterium]|nr:hypothetical protein [Candidatus Methylacidiphilales bacterium]
MSTLEEEQISITEPKGPTVSWNTKFSVLDPEPPKINFSVSNAEPLKYFAHHFVRDGDKLHPCAHSLHVDVEERVGTVKVENAEFSIIARGRDLEEAIDEFDCMLLSLYESLQGASDEELTPDTVVLRDKLLALFSA